MTDMEISGNTRHGAIDALIEAGFVDPDDGTVPHWHKGESTPVWTVPARVVDVVLAAALPHLLTEVAVHHYDIEKHAASFNEGYDEANRQRIGGEASRNWLTEKVWPLLKDHIEPENSHHVADQIADALLSEADLEVPPTYDQIWRELAEAEMAYRGFTAAEIEVASRIPEHTDDCEFESNTYSWICGDEDGKSFHPMADEYGEIVDLLGRALGTLAERSATEVKSMCETAIAPEGMYIPQPGEAILSTQLRDDLKLATDLGYALGRKEALEEAEKAVREFDIVWLEVAGLSVAPRGVLTALGKVIRNIASQPPGAASNGLTASSRHPDTPEAPEAVRTRRAGECSQCFRDYDQRPGPACDAPYVHDAPTPDLPKESDQ